MQDTVENVRLLSKIHPYVTRRLSSVRNDNILFYRKKLLKFCVCHFIYIIESQYVYFYIKAKIF